MPKVEVGDRAGRLRFTPVTATAHASWRPTPREQAALARQQHVQSFGRVDQLWPWLSDHHGEVLAVDAQPLGSLLAFGGQQQQFRDKTLAASAPTKGNFADRYGYKKTMAMYRAAVDDEPYSFLYVDLLSNPPKFYIRFEKEMT